MSRARWWLLGAAVLTVLALPLAAGAAGVGDWAIGVGSINDEWGEDVAVDADGNHYFVGMFAGSSDFDPSGGVVTKTSAGGTDGYVAKYDTDGDLVWVATIGGTLGDEALAVDVDATGNVYVAGRFSGTADFDPGAGTANLTSNGGFDGFLLKLNSTGGYVWAHNFGGTANSDDARGVAVDDSGNVYGAGKFASTVDFEPGAGSTERSSTGSSDAYVVKLNSAGTFQWVAQMGGSDVDQALALELDSSGNPHIVGVFKGSADFNPGVPVFLLDADTAPDAFVVELTSAGGFIWAGDIGGAGDDYGYGLAIDDSDNVYVAGYFSATADFEPGLGTTNLTVKGGTGFDAFVAKFDTSGTLAWPVQLGGTSFDEAQAIDIDDAGNVVVTGYFEGTADFDPGAGTSNLTSAGGFDIFVARLDSAGAFIEADRFGSTSYETGYGVAATGGTIAVTGYFSGTVDFDPGVGTIDLVSAGGNDSFMVKYATDLDGDGVGDDVDNCPTKKNASQTDKDGDGIGNKCDPDLDGDGVDNETDNCPNKKNGSQADKDGDGIGNKCDDDNDGDGVDDDVDNCPNKKNASQTDKDGDGIGNKCDPDLDGDGVDNVIDNCPNRRNASQADKDGDGIGNKCDPD